MAINRRVTILKKNKKQKTHKRIHSSLFVPENQTTQKGEITAAKRGVLIFYASFFQEGTNDFHILCHTCCQNKSLYTFKATSLIREIAVSDIINMKGRHFAALTRNERCPWLNFFDIFWCRRKLISWTVSPLSSTKKRRSASSLPFSLYALSNLKYTKRHKPSALSVDITGNKAAL